MFSQGLKKGGLDEKSWRIDQQTWDMGP